MLVLSNKYLLNGDYGVEILGWGHRISVENEHLQEEIAYKEKSQSRQAINLPSYKMFHNCGLVTGQLPTQSLFPFLFQAEKADRRQSFASLALRKRYSYLTEPGMSEFSNTFTNICGFF